MASTCRFLRKLFIFADSQEAREKSSSRRKNRLDTPAAQFGIKVEDLTESRLNATIVLTASQKFDKKVLRYVVIYWPERRPNAWNERFGGVDEDKNHVLIDELRPGTPYFVRSTALLGDGTHEQVEANFSTPGLPSHDQLQTNVSTQALGHPLMIRPPTGEADSMLYCTVLVLSVVRVNVIILVQACKIRVVRHA